MFLTRLNRFWLFAKRALRVVRLGLTFRGTTGFALPSSAKLQNREVPLNFPDDGALALDIIDVRLDDDYGLENLDASIKTVVDVGGNVGLFTLWAHHRQMEYHLTEGRTLDDLRDASDRIGFEITKIKGDDGFVMTFMDRRSTLAFGTY